MSVRTPNTTRSRTITHIAPAQQRVDAAAVAARAHVAAGCPDRRRPLQQDLPPEQHERARDVEAVGEEGPVARVRALLGLHAADGQDHLVGLAREQVAAARAAVGEQPGAGGVAPLDLGAVGGRRAGHQRAGLLLHPAERRDVLVRAEQDPGLAGAGLRGEVGSPTRRAGSRPRRSSAPCSGRCRRASRGAAPAARARRSRGRRSPGCPCESRRPGGGRCAGPRAASTRRRRWCPSSPVARSRRRPSRAPPAARPPNESDRDELGQRVVGDQQCQPRRRAARAGTRARA